MTTLSNLKIVKRDLKIQNNTITDLSLDSLKEVNGEIIIKENNKLTDLNLKSLDTVTKFTLENNELLQGKETQEGEKVDVKPANQVAFTDAGTSPIFNNNTLEQNNINIQNVNLESFNIDESKVDLNPKRIGNIVALNNGLPKNFKVEDGKQLYLSDINIKSTNVETEYQGYFSGVLANNGKIYCPPFGIPSLQKNKVLEIDPTIEPITFKYVGGDIGKSKQFGKYLGGVLANNGKIYCPPFGSLYNDLNNNNTREILEIDPTNEHVKTTTIFDKDIAGELQYAKYHGGVLANNGKIYCPPYGDRGNIELRPLPNTRKILEIDPTNGPATLSLINIDIGKPKQFEKYIGGILANNGKIYCPPFGNIGNIGEENTNNILVIDPTEVNNVKVEYITINNVIANQEAKYSNGILANNGKIYCLPYGDKSDDDKENTRKILEINPSKETASFIEKTIGSTIQSNKYIGGVLANNGKIYCPPFGDDEDDEDDSENTRKVLVITPNDGGEDVDIEFIEKTIGSTTQSNKYTGGVLANNGKIYCNPFIFNKLLVIDPSSES